METLSIHLDAQILKRSESKNAVAAAAYRAGEALLDTASGKTFDYSNRQKIEKAGILAPEGAPEWVHNRAELWNAVERTEKRKDAQLARELQISLPASLPPEIREKLVWDFCAAHFVSAGMVADIALHGPGVGDDRNHHAHVMLTMRRLDGDGFGGKAREWNRNEMLDGWKAAWEAACNKALEEARANVRVDRRSLAARRAEKLEEAEALPEGSRERVLALAEAERLNYTPRPHLPQTPYRAMVAGEPIPPKWAEKVKAWKASQNSRAEAQRRAQSLIDAFDRSEDQKELLAALRGLPAALWGKARETIARRQETAQARRVEQSAQNSAEMRRLASGFAEKWESLVIAEKVFCSEAAAKEAREELRQMQQGFDRAAKRDAPELRDFHALRADQAALDAALEAGEAKQRRYSGWTVSLNWSELRATLRQWIAPLKAATDAPRFAADREAEAQAQAKAEAEAWAKRRDEIEALQEAQRLRGERKANLKPTSQPAPAPVPQPAPAPAPEPEAKPTPPKPRPPSPSFDM